MPDASTFDPEVEPAATSVINVSGGVNLDAQRDVNIDGDVVGGDKVTTIGYTVEQVSSLLTQISSTFQPKPFDGRCPYLGLDAFSEDDADRFFGRETLVNELIVRVKTSRFVVIAGPSGSGKSSLVRAGLIHALKQGALPAAQSDRWLYATLTPGRDPIESLALALSRLAKSPEAGRYLREHSAEATVLHELIESQLSDRQNQRAVLFVDQFEEVFTQVSQEDKRTAFLNLLTQAATSENGRVTVLLALRSDFVSNCAPYPRLNALLNQQFMQVGAMQPAELVSAVARPALQVGLRIDPDLIAQVVNDMQDEPGALPLMQFALKDLFDAQQARGGVIALTLSDYLERGGLRKALERHADAALASLTESEPQLARMIFSGLIRIGHGVAYTRRTAAFDELVPADEDATQVKVVAQKLADARLLITDEQNHRVTVTLAHERLIDAWPWLRQLVNENHEAIALHNQIAEDAQLWNANEHDASYLYRGRGLAIAEQWSQTYGQWMTAAERSFLKASQMARRWTRLWRAMVGGVAVIVVIVLMGLALTESAPFQQRWAWRSVPELADKEVLSLLWMGDDVVYAGLSSSPNGAAIARSRDGGLHWEYLNLLGADTVSLAADDDRLIYASLGKDGLFRSDDGGDSWQRTRATLPITQVSALVVAPDGALYIGDDSQASGIWVSRDQGDTWARETGIPDVIVYSLIWSDQQLLVGTSQGVWTKSDGAQWQHIPIELLVVYGLGALDGNIYVGSWISGTGEIRLEPFPQLTWLDAAYASSLDVARQPYLRVVVVAPLKAAVLEWRPAERRLQQIADSAALANAVRLNVVAIHDDVWVGTTNGLHRGRLLHWYESDPR